MSTCGNSQVGTLIFVILILIIIFIISFGCCFVNQSIANHKRESFISPNLKQSASDYINRDLSKFDNYLPSKIIDFWKTHQNDSILVEINNEGQYKIHYSNFLKNSPGVEIFVNMMKSIHSAYENLPPCTFVQFLGDGQLHLNLPIFQNSVPLENDGVMSPLWYYFSKNKINSVLDTNVPWENKKDIAIWRGASTGKINGPRRQIVDFSKSNMDKIDAKFTHFTSNNLELENITLLGDKVYTKGEHITPQEQCSYKYIVSVDGNGGTYGLYWVLASDSCPLNRANYRQWFSPFFRENIHYLSLDLDNFKFNDSVSKSIAIAGRDLSRDLFQEQFIIWYMYELIKQYSEKQMDNPSGFLSL